MKFLLDHDVPAEIAHLLRRSEIATPVKYGTGNIMSRSYARTVLPVTASDEEVFGQLQPQSLSDACSSDPRPSRYDHPDPTQNAPLGMRPSIGLLQRAGEKGLRNNVNFA